MILLTKGWYRIGLRAEASVGHLVANQEVQPQLVAPVALRQIRVLHRSGTVSEVGLPVGLGGHAESGDPGVVQHRSLTPGVAEHHAHRSEERRVGTGCGATTPRDVSRQMVAGATSMFRNMDAR